MLRRVALASLLLAACRETLETAPDAPDLSPSCAEAPAHSDLAFIENKIFKTGCVFSSCHDGTGAGAGEMNLKEFMSHTSLVNVDARTDSEASPSGDYKLVVPNEPRQSYLMFMIRHYSGDEMTPPAGQPHGDVGFMPQDDSGELPPLCVEKREAIVRWIEAGAPARM